MLTDSPVLPKACRGHVDLINQALAAGKDDLALYHAYRYLLARVKHIQGRRREQDADGFRRHAVYWLADLAGKVHTHTPPSETRLVPGGDWEPGPGSRVQHP